MFRRCPLRWLHAVVLALAPPAIAADVGNCLDLLSTPGAINNVCADWLNFMYCVDGATGTVACTEKPKDIITLVPGNRVALPGYDGRAGTLHWAVCAYPEAPVGWEPAKGEAYTCKKTCVMC
jgi:hypothetical protein